MERLQLAITFADGQVVHADLQPEDEKQLAELLGERSTFQISSSNDDLEGHAFSGDVLVNVLNHTVALRLPSAADAAYLRRALAVGALTATIVGAGVIAAVPLGSQPVPIEQAPAHQQVLNIPAMAIRAQQAEMARDRAYELANVPLDVDNPAIPAQALRAEQAEMAHDRAVEAASVSQAAQQAAQQAGQGIDQGVPLDADNPAIPAQAKRAGTQ